MHISHCSTLKITPITDLCLQQSDKKKREKKCFDAFAVRTRAHFSSRTKQKNKEGARFIFQLQLFFVCFLEGRRGRGGGWEWSCMLRLRAPLHLHCSNHQRARGGKKGHTATCSSLALVIGRALCTCTSRARESDSKDQFSLLSTLLFVLLDAALPSSLPLFWFSSSHCLSFPPRPRSRLTC